MRKYPARFYAEFHEPKRNEPCLCGSGLKFKKCCSGQYSSAESAGFRSACKQENYQQALIHIRGHITWYVLSHRAHTIPFLETGSEESKKMLSVDIEALSHLLGNLRFCYIRTEISDKFISALEVAENYISDPRWDAKIAYHRGLWFAHIKSDTTAAYEQLQTIDVSKCNDSEFLSLYIEMYHKKLSFDELMILLNRILDYSDDEETQLHYRILKATQYLLIEEQKDCLRVIDKGISEFERTPADERTIFGRITYAYALKLYGAISSRSDISVRCTSVIKELLSNGHASADLHRLLGDCYCDLNNFEASKKSYQASLKIEDSELTKIFIAECDANENNINSAREQLNSIDESLLDKNGYFDLAIAWSKLALHSLEKEDLTEALNHLSTISPISPYFRGYRDKLKIDLLQITPKSQPGTIKAILLTLNKYITVKPNIFGLGVDLNQVIEDKLSTPLREPNQPENMSSKNKH